MKKLNKKGFTLIEVVLVLAIGGLIFLLAFIAFQQVSTNRRDTVRRSDAGRVLAELQNYFTDSRKYPAAFSGGYWSDVPSGAPSDFEKFSISYLGGSNFKSPRGDAVLFTGDEPSFLYGDGLAKGRVFQYGFNKACDGSSIGSATVEGSVAVRVSLEKGTACRDSK